MKALMIATTLMLAATPTATWAQAPAAGDPHHPLQTGTPAPAPTQPAPPPGQAGMGMMGDMPMMNMMGDMPMMMHMMHMHMMAMMRMMGMGPGMAGMAAIDRIEGRIAFLRAELKITETQASAWNAFADALHTNSQKLGQVRASMTPQGWGRAWPVWLPSTASKVASLFYAPNSRSPRLKRAPGTPLPMRCARIRKSSGKCVLRWRRSRAPRCAMGFSHAIHQFRQGRAG